QLGADRHDLRPRGSGLEGGCAEDRRDLPLAREPSRESVVRRVMAAALRLAAAGLLLASCAGPGQALSASAAGDELVVRTAHDIQVRDAKGDLLRSFGRAVAAP